MVRADGLVAITTPGAECTLPEATNTSTAHALYRDLLTKRRERR
jgi:hypothetical protein